MRNRFVCAAVLFACALALRGQTFYRIELVPTGQLIAKEAPVWKGTILMVRRHPDGTFVSLRKADVKKIAAISKAEEALSPSQQVIQIGDLAMQGGSSQAGPTNARAVGAAKAPELGKGFYSAIVPGQTQGFPNSPNDYQVGRTFAGPPGNATQSAPGAPPTMPAATSGQNPPQYQ
jgi:hypothetical protein